MKKQYKLIKKYPGSPELGTINGTNGNTIPLSLVENQSEFWEEIIEIEKDYEILSFICDITLNNLEKGMIVEKHNDSNYFKGHGCNDILEKYLNLDHWKIHSIKRLSDSEIFTLGDKLDESCISSMPDKVNKISSIRIVQNPNSEVICSIARRLNTTGLLLFSTLGNNLNLNVVLSEAKKEIIKIPLFKTEDGVDIFKGDSFYYVRTSNGSIIHPLMEVVKNDKTFTYEPQYEKYFSTKEKAEEYILMNKPTDLTLNEIKEYLVINIFNKQKFEELIELVKSKNI